MATINMKSFEESRRHQLISEYQISPMQSAEQSDYQIKLGNVPSSFKEDARIVMKELLNYWVESQGSVWSKLPKLPINTPKILYSLAGNPSAASASNGTNTFVFFDDFNDNSLDASKWDITSLYGTGSILEQNQRLELTVSATAQTARRGVITTSYFTEPVSAHVVGRLVSYDLSTSRFVLGYRDANYDDAAKFRFGNTQLNIYTVVNDAATDTGKDSTTGTDYSLYINSVGGNVNFKIPALNIDITNTKTITNARYAIYVETPSTGSITAYVDTFYVRKYASPEPIVQKLRTMNRALLIKHFGRAG
jgi:hypothetical protein